MKKVTKWDLHLLNKHLHHEWQLNFRKISKARNPLEGLVKTGVIVQPFTKPKSNNLLRIVPVQFKFSILPLQKRGKLVKGIKVSISAS